MRGKSDHLRFIEDGKEDFLVNNRPVGGYNPKFEKSWLFPIYKLILGLEQAQDEDLANLKKKTLWYYRRLLIKIPNSLSNHLDKQVMVEDLKLIFGQTKNLNSVKELKFYHKIFVDILNKIESGVYPPFPKFEHSFIQLEDYVQSKNQILQKAEIFETIIPRREKKRLESIAVIKAKKSGINY